MSEERFENPDQDGTYPNRALLFGASPEIHIHDPAKCGEWLATLDFDTRQRELERFSSDEDRQKVIDALPPETRAQWVQEEKEHLEELVKGQPVEGAEFAGEAGEEVKIDGQTEGAEQPASAADAELIATLVRERIEAEGRANAAERKLEEANAEVNAYYERFGPLSS